MGKNTEIMTMIIHFSHMYCYRSMLYWWMHFKYFFYYRCNEELSKNHPDKDALLSNLTKDQDIKTIGQY